MMLTAPAQSRPYRCSSNSCWRIVDLSIERDTSRICQGAGLRRMTLPSLSSTTRPKPRGRRFSRHSEGLARSVSVIMITSRSTRTSIRSSMNSIWVRNCGSNGLSAKTIKGRACQIKSPGDTSSPSKIVAGSCSHVSSALSAAANVPDASHAKSVAVSKFGLIQINIVSESASANRKCVETCNFPKIAMSANTNFLKPSVSTSHLNRMMPVIPRITSLSVSIQRSQK